MASKQLHIKLVRSPIGYSVRQKRTVRALGLRKLNQVVEQPDTPAVRGMIFKVSHLVEVEEVEEEHKDNETT
jgi:large subunit ribosomal protein L30